MADTDFIGVDVQGLAEARELIRKAPKEAQDAAGNDVATYLVNSLKAYPTQRHVTRAEAYPNAPFRPGFFSKKQWGWFWANIGNLQIPYRRSQNYRKGWKQVGFGIKSLVVNETPYAAHLQDDQYQSRMAKLGGWQRLGMFVAERVEKIARVADAAAQKAIDRLDRRK